MKKRICIALCVILVPIVVGFIINRANSDVNTGMAKVSGKEISYINSKFEKFSGINKCEDLEKLLNYCIEYYKENYLEPGKVPTIRYKTENSENILEYDEYQNYEKTEYYIWLNEKVEDISTDKLYRVEFKYDTEHVVDNISFINEIEIIEIKEQ